MGPLALAGIRLQQHRHMAGPRRRLHGLIGPGMNFIAARGAADGIEVDGRVLATPNPALAGLGDLTLGVDVGTALIAMTRRVEDLLIVYLLAREAGLAEWTAEGLRCPLPVVPLRPACL